MRMRAKRDFDRAYARGRRARGPNYVVLAARGEPSRTRLGLAIGKRAWKLAVHRNRVRRILREAFRLEYAALPPGFDLVVMAAGPGVDPDLATARRELVDVANLAAERVREREGSSR